VVKKRHQQHIATRSEVSQSIAPNPPLSRLLTPKQAAEFLGVTEGTLATWRCVQRYRLPYIKVGRRVMYRSDDIETFISSRCVDQVA
jgi:excisionase family DNA binding protein